MNRERLVVIGGDAAGMSAAATARRKRHDLDILVFEKGPHTSCSACGIPYYIGDVVQDFSSLIWAVGDCAGPFIGLACNPII